MTAAIYEALPSFYADYKNKFLFSVFNELYEKNLTQTLTLTLLVLYVAILNTLVQISSSWSIVDSLPD